MTLAEIITDVRNLVNEISTDAGALLSDAGNLLTIINDAQEQVVMDLMKTMSDQFLFTELVSVVDGTPQYALTANFWQIIKIEKYTTGQNPQEIEIIDPLRLQYYTTIGEEADEPHACYIIGSTIYFVPTPGRTTANYARVWGLRAEPAAMAIAGPTYLPALAHRLIVYKAAVNIAIMLEANPQSFAGLYMQRLAAVKKLWWGRTQSQPRFIRESAVERTVYDSRDKALVDLDWP